MQSNKRKSDKPQKKSQINKRPTYILYTYIYIYSLYIMKSSMDCLLKIYFMYM